MDKQRKEKRRLFSTPIHALLNWFQAIPRQRCGALASMVLLTPSSLRPYFNVCARIGDYKSSLFETPHVVSYLAPAQSARGLAHFKALRVRRAFGSARQRRGVRWPSTAFPQRQWRGLFRGRQFLTANYANHAKKIPFAYFGSFAVGFFPPANAAQTEI